MHFLWHIVFGFLIRTLLIVFAQWYDRDDNGVHYTDIDYKVFTDAAQHMWYGESPYMRPTYRYTPLIAALLMPNIFLHPCWGKLLFSVFDLAIVTVIRQIVSKSHSKYKNYCAYLWLYNPLSIIISTRGNADSISCFLVLVTLLAHIEENYVISAVLFALSVHVRMYPIIFGLSFYLSIENGATSTSRFQVVYNSLFPSKKRILFAIVFIVSVILITWPCYFLYGQQFLDDSYLYHIRRLDVRHNFSVYFYLNYLLSSSDQVQILYSLLTKISPLILIIAISFKFGQIEDLPFCQFCLCFVMVTYNTVVTSQYFIWFVSFMPVFFLHLNFTAVECFNIILVWVMPQVGWLAFAYLLEFMGINTFYLLWVQSLMFFINNIIIVSLAIVRYKCNKIKKIL
ncbi:GPI mannosyltransferase 1 [Adelges cooleyi]|uniref:GPI mannosyltransferase 1 n=1 Tax=Adelges cooleyi TaxID=133065 RepID=UPI00217F3F12|nr:GPI mannosyltransferase 1 [Adelges cooleyi]